MKAIDRAWEYLQNMAEKNGEDNYEIVEDNYIYENGLVFISYYDKEHTEEKEVITINVDDFI